MKRLLFALLLTTLVISAADGGGPSLETCCVDRNILGDAAIDSLRAMGPDAPREMRLPLEYALRLTIGCEWRGKELVCIGSETRH
jgi:hypothetical protein